MTGSKVLSMTKLIRLCWVYLTKLFIAVSVFVSRLGSEAFMPTYIVIFIYSVLDATSLSELTGKLSNIYMGYNMVCIAKIISNTELS